jgi:small subunit ribosomal protein S4
MKTSVCKLCRREGVKLFLKGNRCETSKCAVQKRNFPPGAHPWTRVRHSEYRTQLREKQKLKRFYGVRERQFTNYYKDAVRMPGNTGENLLVLLERRLDNVLFSLGFAVSRNAARQLIGHGNVLVNGRRCNISSCRVYAGDAISVTTREKVRKFASESFEARASYPMPAWLERDGAKLEAKVSNLPARSDVMFEVREQLVIELMSK